MFESKQRTELDSIGEIGLIAQISKTFENENPNVIQGIGDDAAVININAIQYQVISTDMLIEGVHFDMMYMPIRHLGYKAIATNVSDICAMNAKAKYITVSVGFSNRFSLEAIEELYSGIHSACDKYQLTLIGGDTSTSQKGLFISITVLGEIDKDKITYRKGANEKELVCVTGDLGAAYMGYQLLEREKRIFLDNPAMQPNLDGYDYIVGRQLKPEARVDIVELLASMEVVPTSMIDISDGLASELHHLALHSSCGFVVYEEKIPIDHTALDLALKFNIDPTVAALNGGEDYELLFTIKQDDYEKIQKSYDITVIGYVTEKNEGIQLQSKSGNLHKITAQGWQLNKEE